MEKYGGISLYNFDIENRYKVDDEEICFSKKYGSALIGDPDHPDGTLTDNEYFLIYDDLFERILEIDQDSGVVLNVISKDISFLLINDSSKIQAISRLIGQKCFHLFINSIGKDRKRFMIIYRNILMISN